jgi:iron complex transport system substrate-binding protein
MVKVRSGLIALVLALLLVPAASPAKLTVPQRIVSLSPTATEDLFAIGAGKQVVAVDDQSDYPAGAPKTKLSGYTPNAEAVAGYNPDLVVISNDANGLVAALHKLHIHVLLQPAATKLTDAYAQITALGAATGHQAQARRVVAGMKQRIASAVASLPASAKGLSVYHELEPDLYSVTSKTFIGQIYTMLGLRDIADAAKGAGSGYPKLSAEYIVASNPDVIVLADSVCCGQTAAKVAKRPGWSNINAVKNGDIVAVNDDIASRWGPRVVDFVRIVAARVKAAGSR